jgi:hypothetical protein
MFRNDGPRQVTEIGADEDHLEIFRGTRTKRVLDPDPEAVPAVRFEQYCSSLSQDVLDLVRQPAGGASPVS